MKKLKFKTRYEYDPVKDTGEKNNGELLTVPDQAFEMREIFERASRGIHGTGGRPTTYSDWPHPDLDQMDLVEQHEILEEIREDIKNQRAVIKKREDEELKQKRQAEIDEAVKKATASAGKSADAGTDAV